MPFCPMTSYTKLTWKKNNKDNSFLPRKMITNYFFLKLKKDIGIYFLTCKCCTLFIGDSKQVERR